MVAFSIQIENSNDLMNRADNFEFATMVEKQIKHYDSLQLEMMKEAKLILKDS